MWKQEFTQQKKEKVIKDNSRKFSLTEKLKFLDWEGKSVFRKINENRSIRILGIKKIKKILRAFKEKKGKF